MLNSESYEKGTEEYRKELFADIAMLLLSNPALVKEKLPNASKFVESIINSTFDSKANREAKREKAKADRRSVRQGVRKDAKASELSESAKALKDL
jgi:hypothetical protein